jgi:hypothetical protein
MKYTVEMGSGAKVYIPIFIKTGSGIRKLIGWITQTQNGDRIGPLSCFQNKESRLKSNTGRPHKM